jgi:hypothetical protein
MPIECGNYIKFFCNLCWRWSHCPVTSIWKRETWDRKRGPAACETIWLRKPLIGVHNRRRPREPGSRQGPKHFHIHVAHPSGVAMECARQATSVRFVAFIFFIMFRIWTLTVLSLISSACAMVLLALPSFR